MRQGCVGILALGLVCLSSHPLAAARDAQATLEQVRFHENQVRSLEGDYVVNILHDPPARFIDRARWGFDGRREYVQGVIYAFHEDGSPATNDFKYAYDGDRVSNYLRKHANNISSGRLSPLEADTFRSFPTIGVLFGKDAQYEGRDSLADALSMAESLTVADDPIDGRPTVRIDAIGVDRWSGDPEGVVYDVRVWFDPQRDWRMVKFEKYYSFRDERQWQQLVLRLDDVRLMKVDGVWLPVSGRRQSFWIDEQIVGDITEAELMAMDPLEAVKHVRDVSVPHDEARRIRVDEDTIRLNKPIPIARFRVDYPVGTIMYDEFLDKGYTVGTNDPSPAENKRSYLPLLACAVVVLCLVARGFFGAKRNAA